jgi:transposase
LRFILTGGERNDITQAEALVKDFVAEHVIADKGYDSEAFVAHLRGRDSEAVIPSRATNKVQREIDSHLYKERHLVENQIGKLKHFRRVFTRFDKLAKNYLSFIYFASTLIWLR